MGRLVGLAVRLGRVWEALGSRGGRGFSIPKLRLWGGKNKKWGFSWWGVHYGRDKSRVYSLMTWEGSKFKIGRFFKIQNLVADKQAKAYSL